MQNTELIDVKEKTIQDKKGQADIIKLGRPTYVGNKRVRFVRWNTTTQEYEFFCNIAGRKV